MAAPLLGIGGFYRKRCGPMGRTADAPAPGGRCAHHCGASYRPGGLAAEKLENGFLREIGEAPSTKEKQEQLAQAIRDGKITFFAARRGYRAVGMCSVSRCFSTFTCTDVGIFDDFYIEPVFRKKAPPGCWHKQRRNGAKKTPLPA